MTELERELPSRRRVAPAWGLHRPSKRLPREHVSEAQRMRIISAMTDLACDHGAESIAVSHVISLAGVSRRTFYELFEDRGDCLLAAIEQALELMSERASAAYGAHERWVDAVRAGLYELLALFDQEPRLARLAIVQSPAAGPAALEHRREILDRLARVIDAGRAEARTEPPPLTAEGVVGGVLGVIHTRLLRPSSGSLIELLSPLMSIIVLPYLGAAAARRELSRPSPAPLAAVKLSNGLDGLNVRLTHRTLAVLKVIAAEPGLSNKEIGQRAGVTDAGQISRLLARLADRRLTENTGGGQPMGAANAWRLTRKGEDLENAIRRRWLTGPLRHNGGAP
jgi:AcrR family transcriptional regulator